MDDGIYNGIWNFKSLMGFKKGVKYTFKLYKKGKQCYNIAELNENLFIQCASIIAIKRYFKDIEKIT